MSQDSINNTVLLGAVQAARQRLEERWDAQGDCGSCGWHAALHGHEGNRAAVRQRYPLKIKATICLLSRVVATLSGFLARCLAVERELQSMIALYYRFVNRNLKDNKFGNTAPYLFELLVGKASIVIFSCISNNNVEAIQTINQERIEHVALSPNHRFRPFRGKRLIEG